MAKKKKSETIQDIMDRIQEDIDILRDKAQDLEDNQCECDSSDDLIIPIGQMIQEEEDEE
jgi:hypothetical protein